MQSHMSDTQLLSVFPDTPADPDRAPAPLLVFDACQLGVVLRAVLFVEIVLAVAALFDAEGFMAWLTHLSLLTGAVLPAALLWLVLACLCKRALARLAPWLQYLLAVASGAALGGYAPLVLVAMGALDSPPWLASAASGALLSSVLVLGLELRARTRTPADTAARLAELQSRIRPHFLFNTLNSAIALVRAEPAKAEALLEDLSELFRQALRDADGTVTLGEEISFAQRYLAIEGMRFGARLRVSWDLDPAANDALVPPLLLQPLVENAVLHGVEPSAEGAQLRVSTRCQGSTVVLRVSNSVPAGPGAPGAGVALRNVRARLAVLHDVQAQMRCGLKQGWFHVRLEFPL